MISEAWLRLLAAAAAGGRNWLAALRLAGGAEPLLAMDTASLRAWGLGRDEIARLKRRHFEAPACWRSWLERPHHTLVAFGSEHYPEALAEISDAPLALWVDGSDISLLGHPQLAVVGSRRPTQNGRNIAESFAAELSRSGITITSGLALGIDAAGHRGALGNPGCTIAVLGNGIDHVYPAPNRRLADEIRSGGLIVSEYAPAEPARAWHFPRRNRIIAALSLGTLVVEATRRSGALITARLAADYGREVFAVPGSIHNALSKGCHGLLRDGARLVEEICDVLIEIAPQLGACAAPEDDCGHRAKPAQLPDVLAKCLDYSPIAFDALVSATGLTAAELSSMLLHLELEGKIEALPGGRYCRLSKRGR